MSLPDIRTAIVEALKTAGLGDHVEAHPGKLSVADIKKIVARGNANVRVACIGIPRIEQSDIGPELESHWAAYVIAFDRQGLSRDAAAMIIAASVASLVAGNTWGRDDIDSPLAIRADNLHSGVVEKRAIALWAVTWRHIWTPVLPAAGTFDDLLTVVATWDLDTDSDGEPEPVDTIELEGGS